MHRPFNLKILVLWCQAPHGHTLLFKRKIQGYGLLNVLRDREQYGEVCRPGINTRSDAILKHLFPVMTTLDQFKDIYEYLKQRDMVPGFLAHGGMVLVREVIVETDLLETDSIGECNSIYDAIALSFNAARHDRVASLFEAAKERPDWEDWFDLFVMGFFVRYPPEKNRMPLKRFLALHGETLSKKDPAISETVCAKLVLRLRSQLDDPVSQKLLIGLVGQPFLLTPVALARGFLPNATYTDQTNFIKYGYKEAIEEGLKERYRHGGRKLWDLMVRTLPDQFPGEYPSTDEARAAALENFKPTKQDREEQWVKANAPKLSAQFEQLIPGLFPKVLWNLIFEYKQFTWVDV